MWFGILGPLAVRSGERELNLGGLTQQRILAALLLAPNRTVGLSRLAEVAWDGDPPATARRQVQNRVSALGRILSRAGAAGIITNDGVGYRLRVRPDDLDLLVFDRLAAQGRAAAQAGDLAGAAGTLGRALALWRGPALAGLGGRLDLEAAGLEEKRLAVLEDRIDLDLVAGQHARVVTELVPLIGRYPLRERFVGQLMLALYGSGRQAEAIAAYHELAERLAEELGVDPGPQLRQRYEAVLREEPPVPRTVATESVPAQLPAEVAGFTGRRSYLDELDAALSTGRDEPAVVISAVAGTAGVGKTALAVHWAHRVRDRFPDGQLYVNLRGYDRTPPMNPLDALGRFLRALGVAPDRVPVDVDEAAALYRSVLAYRRVLVVLDNAYGADQVRPLLPGNTGCLVVVTSRDALAGLVAREGARRVALDVLTPSEADVLLARILGAVRVAADPGATAELARLCGYLPLALRIAAANLTVHSGQTVAGYVAALRADDRLAALEVAGDERAAVRVAFDLSYAALPVPAQRLFRLLGLVPGPDITPAQAAALADLDTDEAARLLQRLADAHLIDQPEPGRFAFHDLIRLYAADHAAAHDPEPARRGALDRLYGHYFETADAAARVLYPQTYRLPVPPPVPHARPGRFDGTGDASAWFEAERANLVAAVRYAAEHGPPQAVWLLADVLRGYLWLRLHAVDWLAVMTAGLGAARAEADLAAQAGMLLGLGGLHWRQGRYRQADECFTEALTHSREAGWDIGHGAALSSLGALGRQQGRMAEAARYHGEALALNERSGNLGGQAGQHSNLGLVYWELGRLAESAEHFAQALELIRKLGSRTGECLVLGNLGSAYHVLGRLDEALEQLTEAEAIHREVADRAGEAETMRLMAAVHTDAGRYDRALALAETALEIACDSGYRRLEAMVRNTLGAVLDRQGRYQPALEEYERALLLVREGGDRLPEVDALIGLATVRLHRSESGTAAEHLDLALSMTRAAGYRMHEGQALTVLAAVRLCTGRHAEAVRLARAALAIHEETGHRIGVGRTHRVLADADPVHASLHRAAAAAVFAKIGVPDQGV